MGHQLQYRTIGVTHEAKCSERGCGFFLKAVDTDYTRGDFAVMAKRAFSTWHASVPRKVA